MKIEGRNIVRRRFHEIIVLFPSQRIVGIEPKNKEERREKEKEFCGRCYAQLAFLTFQLLTFRHFRREKRFCFRKQRKLISVFAHVSAE